MDSLKKAVDEDDAFFADIVGLERNMQDFHQDQMTFKSRAKEEMHSLRESIMRSKCGQCEVYS